MNLKGINQYRILKNFYFLCGRFIGRSFRNISLFQKFWKKKRHTHAECSKERIKCVENTNSITLKIGNTIALEIMQKVILF